MFIGYPIKLIFILGGVVLSVILAILDPFILRGGIGPFSREVLQGLFLVADFFAAAYLWHKFNALRVIMNKKEFEDENISKLEQEINRIIKA